MIGPKQLFLKEFDGMDVCVNSKTLDDLLEAAYETDIIREGIDADIAITIYKIVALALSFGSSPLPENYKI